MLRLKTAYAPLWEFRTCPCQITDLPYQDGSRTRCTSVST